MRAKPGGLSQLYFLHIPKTAGSSLTRLLEDSWPAGALAPQRFMEDLSAVSPQELGRYQVVAGHHGLHPATEGMAVITVLRDPAERVWSHYRAHQRLDEWFRGHRVQTFDSLAAFLDDPVYQWTGRDYQARWLAIPPDPTTSRLVSLPPGVPASEPAAPMSPPDDYELESRAVATLRQCALVGTAERLDDFVEALARLVGRPIAQPPRLNVTPDRDRMPPAYSAKVRARSPVDLRLHAAADEALDLALATLPQLPAEPQAELPYEYSMSDPLYGTGWHARVHTTEAGWHRWTGPGRRSQLRLPVRLPGSARLEVEIVSACDDEAVESLQLSVQDRPVAHSLESRSLGVRTLADVQLDPREPLTVTLETAHTRHLLDPATHAPSPDSAGLAVGTVSFARNC